MARQIRIEYPGAIYHITWQRTAGDIRHKSRSISLTRHKIKTTTVSDSDVIRQRKTCPHSPYGVYTQWFNNTRKEKRYGHLLQGRFKGILVDKDGY